MVLDLDLPSKVPKDNILVLDEADLSGDQMVADFEQKLQQLKVLVVSNPNGGKLKPNASSSWVAGLKAK